MELLKGNDLNKITQIEEVLDSEAKELYKKSKEMIEYCKANKGIGLAGPQIGINKKFFVWSKDGIEFETIFNPIYYRDGNKYETIETCLSFPGVPYIVKRWKYILVIYYSFDGEKLLKRNEKINKNQAVIFQHETDHCNGKTIDLLGRKLTYSELQRTKVSPISI
jgi:peptide deformylase